MSRLIPKTVYIFQDKLNQWVSATKEEVRGFRQAKKITIQPGLMMWEPLYQISISNDGKYKYYIGEDSKWYIANVGRETSTLREIKEVEAGMDRNYKSKLINSLISQQTNQSN